jgi:DNA-binding transcriptional MerR regulator
MPVEELARRTGLTVRNLRKLQSCGLLAPPLLVGRKGFYDEQHVARVVLVRRLQDRGFSLTSIRELLRSWRAGTGWLDLLGFEENLVASSPGRSSRVARVAEVLPELLKRPTLLARARDLGLVTRRDGEYIAPNAELLCIVRDHLKTGLPLEAILDECGELKQDVEAIAGRLRASFTRHVLDRFVDAGLPASGLTDLGKSVAKLRSGTIRAVGILLAQAIERGGVRAPKAPTRGSVRGHVARKRG